MVLSTDWLTQALQDAYPGVVVAGARDVGRIESTALKVRIEIDYSDRAGHDRLSRLFVKGYFSEEAIAVATAAAIGPRNGLACREVRFYQELAPLLDVRVPQAPYSAIEPEREIGIVLTEDLEARGARYSTPHTPCVPTGRRGHSRSWRASMPASGVTRSWPGIPGSSRNNLWNAIREIAAELPFCRPTSVNVIGLLPCTGATTRGERRTGAPVQVRRMLLMPIVMVVNERAARGTTRSWSAVRLLGVTRGSDRRGD